MDAQALCEKANNAKGFVPLTFAKTAQGIRCLRNLVTYGATAGPGDANEVRNVLALNEWGAKATFNFTGLNKLGDEVIGQLAKDIVKAG